MRAYLDGRAGRSRHDRVDYDILAHALNERFVDQGSDHPVPYRDELCLGLHRRRGVLGVGSHCRTRAPGRRRHCRRRRWPGPSAGLLVVPDRAGHGTDLGLVDPAAEGVHRRPSSATSPRLQDDRLMPMGRLPGHDRGGRGLPFEQAVTARMVPGRGVGAAEVGGRRVGGRGGGRRRRRRVVVGVLGGSRRAARFPDRGRGRGRGRERCRPSAGRGRARRLVRPGGVVVVPANHRHLGRRVVPSRRLPTATPPTRRTTAATPPRRPSASGGGPRRGAGGSRRRRRATGGRCGCTGRGRPAPGPAPPRAGRRRGRHRGARQGRRVAGGGRRRPRTRRRGGPPACATRA